MNFRVPTSTTPLCFILAIATLSLLARTSVSQENNRDQNPRLPAFFRNVKLTDDQTEKVHSLTKASRAKFAELGQQQNKVFTQEQIEKRRELIRSARQSKKSQAETRKRIDSQIELTKEQKTQLDQIAKHRLQIQKELQSAYAAVLTPAQQKQAGAPTRNDRGGRGGRMAPTHANVSYGLSDRNVMDVWLAKSDKPTPVFFSIHGGGFRGGNKGVDGGLLKACLDQGISVVAITYRLSGEAIAPAQFHDSARAIQFVRSKASEWNLDKTRIASSGGSAGAGISMWLAFHDDLADAENKDPVLRESTRLKCAIVYNGQTTYDPREIKKLIPEANTYRHSALDQLYGIDSSQGFEDLPEEKIKLIEECSPINHVTKDDVPVLLAYASKADAPITNQNIGIHHPRFGTHLKKKMDPLGIECRVETSSRRGSEAWVKQTMAFLKKHL